MLRHERGEFFEVELRHALGEPNEPLAVIVGEHPDRTTVLALFRIDHDERNKAASQALAKHDHPARATVAIEKRVNGFVEHMESDNIMVRRLGAPVVGSQETGDGSIDLARRRRCDTANAIWNGFPLTRAISLFEDAVEPFDEISRQRLSIPIGSPMAVVSSM